MKFPRLSLTQKILAGPAAALALLVAFVLLIYFFDHDQRKRLAEVHEKALPMQSIAGQNIALFEVLAGTFRDAVLARESLRLKEAEERLEALLAGLLRLEALAPERITADVALIRQNLLNYYQAASASSLAIIEGLEVSDEIFQQTVPQMRAAMEATRSRLETFQETERQRANQQIQEIQREVELVLTLGGAFVLGGAALIVGFVAILARSARSSINTLAQSIDALCRGTTDFARRIEVDRADELGTLVESFNALISKLQADHLALSAAKETVESQLSILKKLGREKDEFIGIAAHDLRNPLSGLRGLTEILLESDHEMEAPQRRELYADIFRSAEQMLLIINNLLDLNRIERQGLSPQISSIHPASLCRDLIAGFQSSARKKNQRILFELQEETSCLADPFLLNQVLDNLISNAIKYSPPGSRIWFRLTQNEKFARFAVIDEGPGLSPEDQKKLFASFTRLSARPTGGESSVGLGLSIAKKITEAMHGCIGCESTQGKGSTFFVTFPVDPQPVNESTSGA